MGSSAKGHYLSTLCALLAARINSKARVVSVIVLPRRCEFPGCTRHGDHRHHIVYRPEEVVRRLCCEHHAEITMLNGIHGRRVRHQLSNDHRWWIWRQWTGGKLKPRRTRKALEYIQEWGRKPDSPLAVGPRLPEPIEEAPEKRRMNASKKRGRHIARPRGRTTATRKRHSGE
jgi:hypothetical protein